RLDAIDLLVPQPHGDLVAVVIDGLRIADLARRPGRGREIPRHALLPDRELDHVDLAFGAHLVDFHRERATNAHVFLKDFLTGRSELTWRARPMHLAEATVVPLPS